MGLQVCALHHRPRGQDSRISRCQENLFLGVSVANVLCWMMNLKCGQLLLTQVTLSQLCQSALLGSLDSWSLLLGESFYQGDRCLKSWSKNFFFGRILKSVCYEGSWYSLTVTWVAQDNRASSIMFMSVDLSILICYVQESPKVWGGLLYPVHQEQAPQNLPCLKELWSLAPQVLSLDKYQLSWELVWNADLGPHPLQSH